MTAEEALAAVFIHRLVVFPPAACLPTTWYTCSYDRSLQGWGETPLLSIADAVSRLKPVPLPKGDDMDFLN